MVKNPHIRLLIIASILVQIGCTGKRRFELLEPSETGIYFSNKISESDSLNVYNYPHLYYGAGVGAGDINNDGLIDLYFAGNQVPGKLYLNQGNLKFKDITESSGIGVNNNWETGVNILDINQDGFQDIYINVSGPITAESRANRLYINNGDLTFTEAAEKFGLAEKRQVVQSSFLDYDLDGDLDVFMMVNPSNFDYGTVNNIKRKKIHGEAHSTDVLYRNNGDNTFTDVSSSAGILIEGYGLGLGIGDINNDNWPDIYISNDFLTNDVLYINQQDGTFKNEAGKYFFHTSFAGMGNDIADINNDALLDIIQLDMLPEDNYRQKIMMPGNNPKKFDLMVASGYEPQYTRNTLQLNNGNHTFSEIAFFSGVSSTDWSWSPLFADFDNDGDRDLYVSNGYLRDMGNLDFINYMSLYASSFGTDSVRTQRYLDAVSKLKPISIPNYFYENKNGMKFNESTSDWSLPEESVSHGALYADLDNDGDLDLVVSNTNKEAFILENRTTEMDDKGYLKITLMGSTRNRDGVGVKIIMEHGDKTQYHEHFRSKGYLSSMASVAHFGIGNDTLINSIKITWPDGKFQEIKNVGTNQNLVVEYSNAIEIPKKGDKQNKNKIFRTIQFDSLKYEHVENLSFDFDKQPLLPHTHSERGPGLAVGDINGDGKDDIYMGNGAGQSGVFVVQDKTGFKTIELTDNAKADDMGSLLFDVDNDGDLDLYVVSGGTKFENGNSNYSDRLYENLGEGKYVKTSGALPESFNSGSCVTAADFDKDGDLDLFVGGRVTPAMYPTTPKSMLLRNDSDSEIKFTDITSSTLAQIGMVSDAKWTDFDNDGWVDLMVVGEFMPITFFRNNQGVLDTPSDIQGLEFTSGWWNSIAPGDFDKDGDIDYVIGNLGQNSRYTASKEEPLTLLVNDFDANGEIDPILCRYIDGVNYISHSRDDLIKQISNVQRRFTTYENYARAQVSTSFTEEELRNSKKLSCHLFSHIYLENLGEGSFSIKMLPMETQIAPIYGMLANDYDGNGTLDLVITGNDYGTEVGTGRYNGSIGTFLSGNGMGGFEVIDVEDSGFFRPGNSRGIVEFVNGNDMNIISATNSGPLKIFKRFDSDIFIKLEQGDHKAIILDKKGGKIIREFYHGSSYLSSGSRVLVVPTETKLVSIIDFEGSERRVNYK